MKRPTILKFGINKIKMTQPNIFISCKESRIENNRSFYGCFNLGPFDSGQSLTVANALRRTLLSECPGLGIVSVTIDNVTHEYSTIPGMRESVLDLLLNLKEIVFKKRKNTYSLYKKNATIYNQIGNSYFKPVCGFLKVKGPGVIRAKDLKLPPFLECVDPEQYIATLAEDGLLCMKFIIVEGKGYLLQTQKNNLFSSVSSLSSPESSKGTKASSRSEIREETSKERNQRKAVSNVQDKNSTVSFIDNNLVKNRLNFLSEIQKFKLDLSYTSSNYTPTEGEEYSKKPQALTKYSKGEVKSSKGVKKKLDLTKYSKGNVNQREEININTSINLDTIFNPVTKVSYIIEDFDNKIADDFNRKVNFVDDISTLIESSEYLKENLPFLTQEISLNQSEISKFVDTYSTSEIKNWSNSLHPLKKQSSLHTIVLEVWTNGSLHPRDALYLAFEKLASVFLNMKKTQSYNSIYVNESSLLIASQKSLGIQDLPLLLGTLQNENTLSTHLSVQAQKEGGKIKEGELKNEIEFLNISIRPYTLLKRANINTVSDLCQLTINDLQYICGFNHKYVTNIVNCLTSYLSTSGT